MIFRMTTPNRTKIETNCSNHEQLPTPDNLIMIITVRQENILVSKLLYFYWHWIALIQTICVEQNAKNSEQFSHKNEACQLISIYIKE